MPAWMTSLLRLEVSEPIQRSFSATTTSPPLRARARATARPITPAPTTRQSVVSTALAHALAIDRQCRRPARSGKLLFLQTALPFRRAAGSRLIGVIQVVGQAAEAIDRHVPPSPPAGGSYGTAPAI